VRVDDMGNSYATVAGTGDGLTLGVIGHVDEIGLIRHAHRRLGLSLLRLGRRLGRDKPERALTGTWGSPAAIREPPSAGARKEETPPEPERGFP
jgi:hypothetical protein